MSVDGGGAVVAATVLGRGPVAIVYAGRLAATGVEVAVKVFPDRFDRDTALALDRERRALAAVTHESILPIEAVGEYSGDRSSVVTELCAGSLAGMLTRGALPVSEVLVIGSAVATALTAAHGADVVHGGVTPHNVLFRRTGEPVLGDFGLALRERFNRDPMHALEYTAPETLRDDTRSTASDLYGLGAVLYAMLTGAPPFPRRTGQAPGERILRVLRDPVPPIQAIPTELSSLVSLLLAKNPADRPQDAARVAAWFDHVRGGRTNHAAPALNPLAPPAAHPDTDFDSFAGRPETGPRQHFPPPLPPVVHPAAPPPPPQNHPQPPATQQTAVPQPPHAPQQNFAPQQQETPQRSYTQEPSPPQQGYGSPGRKLIYTAGGDTEAADKARRAKAARWKVAAGIGALVVAAGVTAAVLTAGNDNPNPAAQPPTTTTTTPPKTTTTAPDIGLSVTAVNDLGDRVELKWSAEGDLDFSVVVAGENTDTMVLVANRQRELTVPVDQARKYCFQVRATDSRNIYTSDPVPIRGARCAL